MSTAATFLVVAPLTTAPAQAANTQVVYPANPTARDFNGDTVEYCGTPLSVTDPLTCAKTGSGWKGYQESSLLCFVRGVTCPKWDTTYQNGAQAPAGAVRPYGASGMPGDGFIRTHGTSLAVAPCVPQVGNARWNGPKFTYDSPGASEWRLQIDTRQSYLLLGEGHAGWGVDIMTADGKVATTAVPTQPTLPTNIWRHIDVKFDGSRLERGETYYISIKVAVLHGETAGSWGDVDFDNIRLVTNTEPDGEDPIGDCNANPGDNITEGIRQLLLGIPGMTDGYGHIHDDTHPHDNTTGSFCGLTEGVGNLAEPVLNPLIDLANQPTVASLLDRGEGAFFVVDLTASQTVAWMIGGPALPSSDPRELLAWVHDGSAGNGPDYVVVFAVYNVTNTLGHVLEDPGAAVSGLVQGQLGNLRQVLDDPVGELADLDPAFLLRSAKEFTDTIIDHWRNPTPQGQSLGGRAWLDADGDGLRDIGEDPAEGVRTRLLDCDDHQELAITATDAAGKYNFTGIQPTTAPEGYCVEFDLANYPKGTVFSPMQVAAASANTDSDVDPATEVGDPPRGRTHLVIIDVDEHATNIDAGIRLGAGGGSPDGIGGRVWNDVDLDGIHDDTETAAAGVKVRLMGCDGSGPYDTTVTGANGGYRFVGVLPGQYCVEYDLDSRPFGTTFTRPRVAGATDANDSDVNPITITGSPQTGRSFTVDLTMGHFVGNVSAGVAPSHGATLLPDINGVVWRDTNGDGVRNNGEPRIEGMKVRLIDQATGATLKTSTTGILGTYSLRNMRRGWYRVEFDLAGLPAGTQFTAQADPESESRFNSDVDLTTVSGTPARGRTRPVFYTADEGIPTIGAGVVITTP